ncbi:MAG TPA: efflux RND transporter permease subunit [Rheinheimera sp.]|uniref:efflux RND transporter permease subunit n=1 Tax=Rheinheimera sp. TaxID=1869214 RepID=UPI002B486E34|nr:efflux RND transporter permease subunit [Rheinheimera sp.]HJS14463.1 efflux RND transporter permease subunit [Rheinheimera sp.]
MNLTRSSIKNPAAVVVVSLIMVLFGLLAVAKLPVQLLPSIEQPQIFIQNGWRAAAPEEMESTIIEPQEAALRTVPGVTESSSFIGAGFGFITLTFDVGQDMQQAMLNVINALNQAPPRPREADEPVVSLNSGAGPVASLLIRKLDENADADFTALQPVIDDVVYPRLKAIAGVSQVDLSSRRAKELHIVFDPYRLAALGLSVDQLSSRIGRASNVSGGFAEVGRREYTVRFVGQYDPAQYEQMVVAYQNDRPVYLHEVAEVKIDYAEQAGFTKRNGYPAFYITLQRAAGSNTVEILDALNKEIADLNQNELQNKGIEIVLSFDASVHIKRAIELVNGNLVLGIALALGILYLFLRGWQATLLIGLTIPVSLMMSIMVLDLFGRSLNVVSLAGLAFAVGMVLDAAIIVQENIVRLLQQGLALEQAVKKGTAQVSSALWASTATTVAIFVPVLFMQGVEGQLFYDLALTLAVAVTASLLVALTVLPVASLYWLKPQTGQESALLFWQKLASHLSRFTRNRKLAWVWTALFVPGSIFLITLLLPKADFLPQASIDTVFSGFSLPPGANMQVLEQEIGDLLVSRLRPYYQEKKYPAIKGYNLSINRGFNVLFVYAEDPDSIEDMIKLLREEILVGLPDTNAFSVQGSLFNFGFGSGRELNLDFQGPDVPQLMQQAAAAMPKIEKLLAGATVRPVPDLALAQPELRLTPDENRIAQSGVDRFTVANMVRAVTDGIYIGEYFDGNERMDIILKGQGWQTPEQLTATPLYTPGSGGQTLGQLSELNYTTGPTSLQRVNGLRTISLQVTPPATMALDEAMQILQRELMTPLRDEMPEQISVQFRGNADRLSHAMTEMGKNFAVAVFILFLLMAALFRSAKDSLLVVLTMPMAILGGVVALRVLNLVTFQSLDLLTMIGFVILLGLVVNNAILLVDQCRQSQREGMPLDQALHQAILTRSRPIFMSTLTSIFGMLPLVLVPGVGSEIYRGLAAVIVGGMTFSMLFSLVLIPALLRLTSTARQNDRAPLPLEISDATS